MFVVPFTPCVHMASRRNVIHNVLLQTGIIVKEIVGINFSVGMCETSIILNVCAVMKKMPD